MKLKISSVLASVGTTFLAAAIVAAPGTSNSTPISVPDAATLSRGGIVSKEAMDVIKSKVEDGNVKVAAAPKKPKKPKPKPGGQCPAGLGGCCHWSHGKLTGHPC